MPKYAEEILAAVTELQQHPTAEQVFLEMKKDHPSIAIGTVYKHLNALAEEGLLHRITESGSPDRYDRTERHDPVSYTHLGAFAGQGIPEPPGRPHGKRLMGPCCRAADARRVGKHEGSPTV